MKKLQLKIALLLAIILAGFQRVFNPGALALANSIATRAGARDTKLSDSAIGRRKVVTTGSDASHIAVCGVADIPLGVTEDGSASAAEERVAFAQLGLVDEELEATDSGGIEHGDFVVPAAAGAVRELPTDSGTYYIIGRAKGTSTNGNHCVFVPCFPIQRVVS